MAGPRPRGSSIFSGLILLFIGLLLLLHNYRGFELSEVVLHWWPLVLIFWGAIKLYERTANRPAGQAGGSRITGGEGFLGLGFLALLGIVGGGEAGRRKLPGMVGICLPGGAFGSELDILPQNISLSAR